MSGTCVICERPGHPMDHPLCRQALLVTRAGWRDLMTRLDAMQGINRVYADEVPYE